MAYQIKYRSKNLDELDLKSVRESLKSIVKSGEIPHAFLFSGPKGTGKTSAARILAKILNCENRKKGQVNPCNKCEQCKSIDNNSNIDVVELDAASHRRIDDVRNLRDAVKLAPANAKRKVYIIDEAHMLTTEASNALLKTLEEPPEHVYFVLATTNPEKLIGTIRSRTTNVIFKKASPDEIVRALRRAVKGEGINIDDGVLKIIAKNSGGSFRDAQKILEQIVSENVKVTKKKAEEFVLHSGIYNIDRFMKHLSKYDAKAALGEINNAFKKGVSMPDFSKQLIDKLRKELLARQGFGSLEYESIEQEDLLYLTELFSKAAQEVRFCPIPQVPLEIAIIKWCMRGDSDESISTQNSKDSNNFEEVSTEEVERVEGAAVSNSEDNEGVEKTEAHNTEDAKDFENVENGNTEKVEGTESVEEKPDNTHTVETSEMTNGVGDIGKIEKIWKRVLAKLRPNNASTEALLRASKPLDYDGYTLKLGVYYKFHKEKLEQNQHRMLVEEMLESVLGSNTKVVCKLAKQPKKVELKEVKLDNKASTPDNIQDAVVDTLEQEEDELIIAAREIFN